MGRFYKPLELAKMVGISPATLKVWESQREIPKATRIGLNNRRIWHTTQVKRILEYARSIGYSVPYYPFIEEEVNSERETKESGCQLSLR